MASFYANTGLFANNVDAFGDGPYDPAIAPAVMLAQKKVTPFCPAAVVGLVACTLSDDITWATVTPTTQQLWLEAIFLTAGDVINNFNFYTIGASSGVTNAWSVLANNKYFPVAFSADTLTTAEAATTLITAAVATTSTGVSGVTTSTAATSYVAQYTGLYYVGHLVNGTVATYAGRAGDATGRGAFGPYRAFTSNTSATTIPAFGTALTHTAVATPLSVVQVYLN